MDANDPALGFFHRWVEEFSKHSESIEVICLFEGRHHFPDNVHVHSLGKESAPQEITIYGNFLGRLTYLFNFYRYAWRLRREYDAVFVHMNPEYAVLGGPLWKLLGKRVVLWYVHRAVNLKLRLAVLFANAVATTAPESMRVRSLKTTVVPHGIDTVAFSRQPLRTVNRPAPRLVSVGRITPVKNLETLLRTVALLREGDMPATVTFVGAPTVPSDRAYETLLRSLTAELGLIGAVEFLGSRPNREMPELYAHYDVSVNLCPDGGVDKAVLESMAAGLPVLAANRAFEPYFSQDAPRLLFAYGDANDLAEKLQALLASDDLPTLQERLRARARAKADVSGAVSAIINLINDPGSQRQL